MKILLLNDILYLNNNTIFIVVIKNQVINIHKGYFLLKMNVLNRCDRNKYVYILLCILIVMLSFIYAADDIETIEFEELQIEGKIRRPQLVLIKAEQRPNFTPMVMQSLDSDINVAVFSSSETVEKSPYGGVFKFEGEKISNYVP